ncbi:MAG: YdeI/OmpD-associated family protein [Flavobacteriales bacterium]|nr:YdeI/OmpD-associated family protein [Flavobacteriales bacterium]
MKQPKDKYSFTSDLEDHRVGMLTGLVLIPLKIIKSLPEGRKRAKGAMNGAHFSLAIQNLKTGERYFAVSNSLRKDAKIKSGDPVKVEFYLVDPNIVELPEELEAVLAQDPEAEKVWLSFTPGRQRSLAHYVNSVKNIDSRIKRALELCYKAKTGTLFLQKGKDSAE